MDTCETCGLVRVTGQRVTRWRTIDVMICPRCLSEPGSPPARDIGKTAECELCGKSVVVSGRLAVRFCSQFCANQRPNSGRFRRLG